LVLVIRVFIPMRVDDETEVTGLDLSVHGERAYDMTS
jgi:Amt family ammonium transporter